MKKLFYLLLSLLFLALSAGNLSAQQSVARQWNEAMLQAIRNDLARPPVHARNLFHVSMAMWDAWAAYDTLGARTYLLGKTVGNYTCPFNGVPAPADIEAARAEAISHAAYAVLRYRFQYSPNAVLTLTSFRNLMISLGYNPDDFSTDYNNGDPAALGNYIGNCVIFYGLQDGSNEGGGYSNMFYNPVNLPLNPANPGDPFLSDPNRWQPLLVDGAIDQNGNPIPSLQRAQSPEWGRVVPFAIPASEKKVFTRNNVDWIVYHDPGPQPMLDTTTDGDPSEEYRWNFNMVSIWGSHLTPNDNVMWDISPATIGNTAWLPNTFDEYKTFYGVDGHVPHQGRTVNPKTGLPYQPQIVPRGDYTRVLAQFWADGPNSETPPGHWFSILNNAMDHPQFVRRFNGTGPVLSNLEFDVKIYFTLGAALHDAAISAWGIKGWYDGVRPVSALRWMADQGQNSDPGAPRYDPAGIQLVPGYIEQVQAGDTLAGANGQNIGKIKLLTWKGHDHISFPSTDIGDVGWILAENFWPYQRRTFVTPPFPGYISGHSTYSSAAAEVITLVTGDEYFPGGMGEYHIAANSGFLGFEQGPTVDITLQWATYKDAADQTSLSRIWGGIHPPVDDIPGRKVGKFVGTDAFNKAKTYFFPQDSDGDGFNALVDCDDNNPALNPGAVEICDGIDNNCNGQTDENLSSFTYYADNDGDGYGSIDAPTSTCFAIPPTGYTTNSNDCDDNNPNIYVGASEICDGFDNNCDGQIDEGIPLNTFYRDEDGDGYGNSDFIRSCDLVTPIGYATETGDCNDQNPGINPGIVELCDNMDNNCNGLIDENVTMNQYFFDNDGDGYGDPADMVSTCSLIAPSGYVNNSLDCNDLDPLYNPSTAEICDGFDNNCDGQIDEGLPLMVIYADADGDGFGAQEELATCETIIPIGYVGNNLDCDDTNANVNPDAVEICDLVDNNCNGVVDENLSVFTYFEDADADGFGTLINPYTTCQTTAPIGYVVNSLDCDDTNPNVNPGADEGPIPDSLDNDCNGLIDDIVATREPLLVVKIQPNPVYDWLSVTLPATSGVLQTRITDVSGKILQSQQWNAHNGLVRINFSDLPEGVYLLWIIDLNNQKFGIQRVVKM